ncbi:MAG TPA: nuclear transport factor 2 family protein, partial [Pyrinomonadaceae bacterium]
MHRLILISLVLISLSITVRSQSKPAVGDLLISYEQQSWAAVKQKDYKKFANLLADDFYDIFSNGQVVTKQQLLQDYIRGVDLIDYSLSKFHVIVLDNHAAIVVYEAVAHGSETQSMAHDIKKGEVTAIHVAVTSGWAKR